MEEVDRSRPRSRVFRVTVSEDHRRQTYWHVWITIREDLRAIEVYPDLDAEGPQVTVPIHRATIDWRAAPYTPEG